MDAIELSDGNDISIMAENLSIGGHSSSPPNKRARAGGTAASVTAVSHGIIISFIVDIEMDPNDLLHQLDATLEGAGSKLPAQAQLVFQSIINKPQQKQAFIALPDSGIGQLLGSRLVLATPSCFPFIVPALPPQPFGPGSVDVTASVAHNCKIKCCPHRNFGQSVFGASLEGKKEAHMHGNTFHHDYLRSLDATTLKAIGWGICKPGCNDLIFGCVDHHRLSCADAKAAIESKPPALRSPEDANLFAHCPPIHHEELNQLIRDGTDMVSLSATVFQWMTRQGATSAGANVNA